MSKIFVIEDQNHAEWIGEFDSIASAWAQLKKFSELPWDARPNRCPCQSWRTCGRDYEIQEYDNSSEPWDLINQFNGLEVSASGVTWGPDAPRIDA